MKKVLQFSGLIALVLAVLAFVLMMVTNAAVQSSGSLQVVTEGTKAIFGKVEHGTLVDVEYKLAPMALLAWIFILVGMIILAAGVILPLLKIDVLEKFAGILAIVSLVLLVLGGIFMFFVLPSYFGANGYDSVPDNASIGAGWVIGGILAIAGGAFAILPAAAAFFVKK